MHNSFKNKVVQFWKAFEEEEATIRQMIDNKADGKVLTSFTESILRTAFNEVYFQIGINLENKYELTLTPQGDRVKLIEYYYWSQFTPDSLKKDWVFHSSKPALKNTQYEVTMFGITLNESDIILYPEVNMLNSKVELQVYCPKLKGKSDLQRYSILFTLLDQHISELYTIEHISNIHFVDQELNFKSTCISKLKKYIDTAINEYGWINSDNPLHGYIGYKVNASEELDWILREDIYVGYSSCTAPISSYHFKDERFFRKYEEDGVVFGFLFYENGDLSNEEIVPFRALVEDQIMERTASAGIANSIGGATGFHFSYIDIIIYDYNAFIKIAKEILSAYDLEEAGFSYFLAGSKPIMMADINT